jgi:hypothetical protein
MPEALKGDRCARLANDVVRQKKAIWVGPLTALLLGVARVPASAAPVTVIDPDAHYPQGPLWRSAQLLFVECAPSNIKSSDGRHTRGCWHKDHGGANSLIPFDGHLLVACRDDDSLVELDANGTPLPAATTSPPAVTVAATSLPADRAFEQCKPPFTGTVYRWNEAALPEKSPAGSDGR